MVGPLLRDPPPPPPAPPVMKYRSGISSCRVLATAEAAEKGVILLAMDGRL